MADLWLQIRPGTDVALMLGWIRIIIEEELYDHDFVADWTVGFEDLKAAAASYTPEKVSQITHIPPELVIQSVRMYATNKPAVIPFGYGLDKQGQCDSVCPGPGDYPGHYRQSGNPWRRDVQHSR
jgi:thiosulfate reductase/polysulfide reductase chain A